MALVLALVLAFALAFPFVRMAGSCLRRRSTLPRSGSMRT